MVKNVGQKMNDAEKLAPKMVRDYIRQPGHKSIR